MLKKNIYIATCLGILSLTANNAQAFMVKNIKFNGLDRIPLSSVKADIPVSVGQDFDLGQSSSLISDLYKTGYFSQINLYDDKGTLVINVTERPTIASVDISGNEKIKTDQLQTVLANVGMQVGNMYNPSILSQIQNSLEQEYNSQGKYAIQVNTTITPESRNRVGIAIKISEGLDATIERINIVGNQAFNNKELIKQLAISTPSFFAFFTGADKYSQDKLNQSLQALSDYYMNQGYADFRIDSSQVAIDSTKSKIFLTINVTEGPKYTFSGFKLAGNLILPESQLDKLVTVKSGDTFSKQTVMNSATAVSDAIGDQGYAFVNVNPVPTIDATKKQIFITLYVTPGKKVYVRNIIFNGNTVVNDKTLRERMKFVEGSLYGKTNLNNSQTVLQRLPYLSKVDEDTEPVPNTQNQVNEAFNLTETSANQVSGNIGYSELDGVIVGAGLSMPDVFGTGNIFSIQSQVSKPYQSVNFGFTQPFFTASGISQSINLYMQRVNNSDRNLTAFTTNSFGGTLNYAIPISTWNYLNVGGGYDHTQLVQPQDDNSETVSQFVSQYGSLYNTYTLSLGLSRDTTNAAWFPTAGVNGSTKVVVSVPGSNLTWYQLLNNISWYQALTKTVTLELGGNVDFGNGYGSTNHLPFIDNFYGGGWGSVRGFEQGTMGPQDTVICTDTTNTVCQYGQAMQGQALGGNLSVNASANLYFPVPFTSDNPNLKLIAFVDSGNVYNTYRSSTVWNYASLPTYPTLGNLRYTTGIGIEWVSPLGPLAFSVAQPLNAKSTDDTRMFQFSLGTFFN